MIFHRSRYLKPDRFVSFCRSLNVEISENDLEHYEKKGLLFPVARIIQPPDFVKYMEDIRHNPKNPFFGKIQYEYPDEFEEIHNLVRGVNFSLSGIKPRFFHGLDKYRGRYIVDPSKLEFEPWGASEITVEIDDRKLKLPLTINFYHYWQVYQVVGIQSYEDRLFKQSYIEQVREGKTKGADVHMRIPIASNPIEKGDYLGLNQGFEWLSFFDSFRAKLYEFVFLRSKRSKDGSRIFSQAHKKFMEGSSRRIASKIKTKNGFSEDLQFEFLKKICTLHDRYSDQEKIKLADCLKKDIASMVRLIMAGTDLKYEDISKRVGRIGGFFEDYLEILFPDRLGQVLKKSRPTLESYLQEFNKTVPNLTLADSELDKMYEFMKSHDLFSLYYSFSELNEGYFDLEEPVRSAMIQTQLVNIASFPEKFIEVIARQAGQGATVEGKTLLPCLRYVFDRESWFAPCDAIWRTETGFRDIADATNRLKTLLGGTLSSGAPVADSTMKYILITGLVRNLQGHRHIPISHIEDELLEILKNLMFSVFHIWHQVRFRLNIVS